MSTDARIVIIGGGVLGLSTALAASELGATDVTVLEAQTLASGSSGLSVGHVGTQFVDRRAMELRARGLDRFAELERDCGLPFRRIGYLRLTQDESDLAAFERAVAAQREFGIEAEVLGPDDIATRVPDADLDGIVGALYGPNDGYTDGHLVCSGYAEKATVKGVRIHQRAAVTACERTARGAHRLITERGTFETDVVVNAAGAWADRVGEILGTRLPVIAQKHQTCLAKPREPLGYVMPIVMNYVASEHDFGLYVRQEGANHLLVGLHTEDHESLPIEDPDTYDRAVTADFVELAAERLAERLPGLAADLGLTKGWSGLYPGSPDGEPIVGPHPEDPTIVAAAGGGSSGVQLSPIIGRLAAQWAITGTAEAMPNAAEFSPCRFSDVPAAG